MIRFRIHPGLSLVEVLLFVGILGLSTTALVAFFLFSTDGRIRETIAADVDQNVIQMQQFLEAEVRQSVSVLDPAPSRSGSILTLKQADQANDPTVLAVVDKYLILIRRDSQYIFSSPDVTVSGFRAFNTSQSADRQSVTLRYTVSRPIPLPNGGTYSRTVEQAISLLPQQAASTSCSCAAPACNNGTYQWQVCSMSVCSSMSGVVLCP